MSERSPFVIYTAEGVPMAFPEDTTYEDVVLAAEGIGDGTRLVRDEYGRPESMGEIALGEVRDGVFREAS